MANYENLADRAKVVQDADRLVTIKHQQLRADPCSFFARVRTHLIEEMNKANMELRKRNAALLSRNHLPGFENEVFLTFGTDSLCRVGLGIMRGMCRVTAVISGPPNGYELSRREYRCEQDANCKETISTRKEGEPYIPSRPDEIAEDIISGFILGRFD
jgi:hypothetical protein